MSFDSFPEFPRKRKKVDYEALDSPLNRIPGMSVLAVRNLLDLGVDTVDSLRGRSPEALFEDIRQLDPKTPEDHLYYFRMAVYFAETDEPDPHLLNPWKWT